MGQTSQSRGLGAAGAFLKAVQPNWICSDFLVVGSWCRGDSTDRFLQLSWSDSLFPLWSSVYSPLAFCSPCSPFCSITKSQKREDKAHEGQLTRQLSSHSLIKHLCGLTLPPGFGHGHLCQSNILVSIHPQGPVDIPPCPLGPWALPPPLRPRRPHMMVWDHQTDSRWDL